MCNIIIKQSSSEAIVFDCILHVHIRVPNAIVASVKAQNGHQMSIAARVGLSDQVIGAFCSSSLDSAISV